MDCTIACCGVTQCCYGDPFSPAIAIVVAPAVVLLLLCGEIGEVCAMDDNELGDDAGRRKYGLFMLCMDRSTNISMRHVNCHESKWLKAPGGS